MDRKFIWGIASYQRPDRQPMLQLLAGMGYTREEILLSVQTEEDYKEYAKRWGDLATLLYRPGKNISDNKNTLLDYAAGKLGNPRMVICSDKVRAVCYLGPDGQLHDIETREQMDALVEKAFKITEKARAEIWGCYSTGNAFFMKHTISTNQQILGCFMGIANPARQQFDPEQPLKEDFEFVLRHIANGRRTIRFNDICLRATLHTQGGCHSLWNNPAECKRCNERILAKYRGLVKMHPTRKDEQKYVGPTQTFQVSILTGLI